MRKFNKTKILTVSVISIALGFFGLIAVYAATSPSLGTSSTFGVLSSTFTNSSATTIINGDVGYTVAGAPVPLAPIGFTLNGTAYPEDATFTAAGIAQGAALTSLNAQACTFTFPAGAVNLATETTHIPAHGSVVGEYYPGVYCTTATSAASIGTAGITLNGAGTYIFRIDGALTTVVNSHVTVSNGASACDVFWTPTEATTIGAGGSTDINFKGTVIDAAGITISEGVKWIGRALAFGGVVTVPLADVEITVPTCTLPTLTVVKQVNGGGPKVAADFPLFVGATSVVTGVSNAYSAGSYVVSETTDVNYTQTFSGSCPNGNISLASGNSYTCTITNTYITPPSGGSVGLQFLPPPVNPVIPPVVTPPTIVTNYVNNLINPPVVVSAPIPGLPNTGLPPQNKNIQIGFAVFFSLLGGLSLFYIAREKKNI